MEVKDGVVSTNSKGIYWKLLTPGIYWVKAVVFGWEGRALSRNDWSRALPIMESIPIKIEVINKTKLTTTTEAQIVNISVRTI